LNDTIASHLQSYLLLYFNNKNDYFVSASFEIIVQKCNKHFKQKLGLSYAKLSSA